MDASGHWVATRTNPVRAKQACLTDAQVLEIAKGTRSIAQITRVPTYVMWFVGVETGATARSCVPWIWYEDVDTQWPEDHRLTKTKEAIQLRLKVGAVRRIRNNADLDSFKQHPRAFDLGLQHVAFRPSGELIRSRDFIAAVADTLKTVDGWHLVLEGSVLTHAFYQLRRLGVDVVPIWEYSRAPRRKKYQKLVRDEIPARIRAGGEEPITIQLDGVGFQRALRAKIVEESLEVSRADDVLHTTEELADLLAVMHALAKEMGIEWAKVEDAEANKRQLRGGFDQATFLAGTMPNALRKIEFQEGTRPPLFFKEGVRRLKYKVGLAASLVPPFLEHEQTYRFQVGDHQIEAVVKYADNEIVVTFNPAERHAILDKQLVLALH